MEILGIDVGGSGIKGAPVNIVTGELTGERHRIPTPQPATPDAIGDVIKELVGYFNWKGKVGIGFPAPVQKGVVLTATNIDNSWIGTNIDSFLSKKTGCDVHVVNDADAAGMAEMAFGSKKVKSGVVLLLTIGTGIGSALFVNGSLLPNTELGNLELMNMSIEQFASDLTRKKEDLNWKNWAKRFNKVLNLCEQLFYPNLFIIGGGVSKKMEKFEKYIDIDTKFVAAGFLNNAGIIGAAVYASEK